MSMSSTQPTFRQTLNRMGGMSLEVDSFSQAFVDFAGSCQRPVLDVGTAFGLTSQLALEKGAHVWANDLDSQHLHVLWQGVSEEQRCRLKLVPGAFPEEINFPSGVFDAVLLARVLHFLSGDQIEKGLRNIHKWLCPSGQIFIVGVTPFLKHLGSFQSVYQRRIEEGDPWPGYVENVGMYDPEGAQELPRSMNFLCPKAFPAAVEAAGFEIIRCETFSRAEHMSHFKCDGREALGLIARKPAAKLQQQR